MSAETPESLLEAIRCGADEAEALRRLVADFPPGRIREALRGRVADLWTYAGETLLQLLEAFGDDRLFHELWANDDDAVSLRGEVRLRDGGPLKVLVEKDFRCRVPQGDEDQSDLFQNPEPTAC